MFMVIVLMIGLGACSEDDPTSPDGGVDLEIDIIEPAEVILPSAEGPILFVVEANLPLSRMVYLVDGEVVGVDMEPPYRFLWDVAQWADGDHHYFEARGETADGQSEIESRGCRIPTNVGGVLVRPPLNGGVPDGDTGVLVWRADPLASGYEVQVSDGRDFGDLVFSGTTADTTITVTVAPHTWQYWHVRSRFADESVSLWSTTGSFYAGMVFDRGYDHLVQFGSLGHTVRQTADGGYFAAGVSGSQPYVMRTDAFGEVVWSHVYPERGDYRELVPTEDGGCVLAGLTSSQSEDDNAALTRFDAEARILIEMWRRQYNRVRPHSSLRYRPPAPEAVPGLPITIAS